MLALAAALAVGAGAAVPAPAASPAGLVELERARLLLWTGQPRRALGAYESAIAAGAGAEAEEERAAALGTVGRPLEAARRLERLLEADPRRTRARLALAELHWEAGDLSAARRHFERALIDDFPSPDAREGLSRLAEAGAPRGALRPQASRSVSGLRRAGGIVEGRASAPGGLRLTGAAGAFAYEGGGRRAEARSAALKGEWQRGLSWRGWGEISALSIGRGSARALGSGRVSAQPRDGWFLSASGARAELAAAPRELAGPRDLVSPRAAAAGTRLDDASATVVRLEPWGYAMADAHAGWYRDGPANRKLSGGVQAALRGPIAGGWEAEGGLESWLFSARRESPLYFSARRYGALGPLLRLQGGLGLGLRARLEPGLRWEPGFGGWGACPSAALGRDWGALSAALEASAQAERLGRRGRWLSRRLSASLTLRL